MDKNFKLNTDEIKPRFKCTGACIATDMITIEGKPVRYMFREVPDHEVVGFLFSLS